MNPQTVPPAPPPDADRARFYADDAERYSRLFQLEPEMESRAQATQRKITDASFDLIGQVRPDVQCFGELLIQYPVAGQKQPGRVVPDNFVVVHPDPLDVDGSFPIDSLPSRPLLVMEYVSKGNGRKDYDDNMVRYEQALRVPYYLLFYPDNEELSLFRLAGGTFQTARPSDAGRFAVPELELEAGLSGGWVRFWFRGERVPIPTELNTALAAERVARLAAERELAAERAARAALEAELARLRGQPG